MSGNKKKKANPCSMLCIALIMTLFLFPIGPAPYSIFIVIIGFSIAYSIFYLCAKAGKSQNNTSQNVGIMLGQEPLSNNTYSNNNQSPNSLQPSSQTADTKEIPSEPLFCPFCGVKQISKNTRCCPECGGLIEE